MNPIFNLVHASDSEQDVIREVPVLFGRPLAEVLAELGEVRPPAGPPLPIDHWRAVGDVVARLLSPSRTELGGKLLREAGWPAAGMSRTAAFVAVRRARSQLRHECGRSVTASAAGLPALLAGTEQNLPSVDQFSAVVTALPGSPSRWHSYLAYTSLRYLDLCLEPANEH
jgi:hypothetical protein